MREKEKMLSGQYYDPGDAQLTKLRLKARLATERLNKISMTEVTTRTHLLRSLFGSVGDNVYIESGFHCDYGENIYVGDNFYANFGCVILDVAEVRIGDNCLVAPQVGIYTAAHPIEPDIRAKGLEYAEPIIIGNNCWIGGHATINPGVKLGDNVVVASGAVVTRSFGSNVVIGGNPAKILKYVD